MTKLRMLFGLVAILTIAGAVFIGGASDTAEAKKAPKVQFGFSATFVETVNSEGEFIGIPPAEVLTRTILKAGNIGSSGQDGVSYQIDSFFDVTYRLFGDPDFDLVRTGTIDIEIVALNLTSADPVAVIDAVERELFGKGKMTDFRGHVTVLK